MTESERPFDSVRMMRELRDELDRQVAQMTPEERVEFINLRAQGAASALGLPPAIDPRRAAERARRARQTPTHAA